MTKQKVIAEPWKLRKDRTRKTNNIPLRKKYLICTEGKTEAIYFSNFRSSTGPIIFSIDKSDQKTSLVKRTIEEREIRIINGEFDSEIDKIWVVFDRDICPSNKEDKNDFNYALQLAKKHNISVAYSNDAFEIWILLHYQEISGSLHRSVLNKKITEHRGKKYSKGEDLYKEIKPNRSIAIKRAHRLFNATTLPPEKANPSTTVHLLVEKLMKEPGFKEK